MKRYLPAWIVAAAVLPILDFAWFALIARGFYQRQIGGLLLPQMNLAPATLFYLGYAVGVVLFVVAPAAELGGGLRRVVARGFVFGLISYGVYDMTNLATLRGFTLAAAVVDMTWGGVATALAAGLGAFAVCVGRSPTSHAPGPT